MSDEPTRRAHQVVGGFAAGGVMFQVHPDAVEAQQAGHLVDAGVGEVAGDDQRRFAPAQFGFDAAESHGECVPEGRRGWGVFSENQYSGYENMSGCHACASQAYSRKREHGTHTRTDPWHQNDA